MYEVGRSLHLLKVKVCLKKSSLTGKPLYTEKVLVVELEEMRKVHGDSSAPYKFYHVEVKK